MTREQYLQWAKDRAIEVAKKGEIVDALASMASDLGKHPELKWHGGLGLGIDLRLSGKLETTEDMITHINGFS